MSTVYSRMTVNNPEDHALAKRKNSEEGRGEGTPKRKFKEGGILSEFESPAKKRNIRKEIDFDFDHLKKFWTNLNKKPGDKVTYETNNEGIRYTNKLCHNLGQSAEIGENES